MNLSSVFCQNGEILDVITELDPLHSVEYQTQDEITFGRLFADTYKSVLKYNVTTKTWFMYDGVIWREDTGSVITGKLAELFQRLLKIYLADAVSANETQFESQYQKYVLRLGDRNKRLKMIEDAKHHTHIRTEDFDTDQDLLNLRNGVLNLKTFELLPHDPELLLSKVCNVEYNADQMPALWEKYLSEVFEDDPEKINYMQRLFGYSLTGNNAHEECYLLYGKTTRNGKSTMLRVMETMMGSYAMSIRPESLAQRRNDGRQASGDIARLKDCRFLHCSEPQKGMVLDVALLKSLTGRDVITARNLYEREFQFVPVFKLFFNSNVLPAVNDMTLFSSGRLKVIEFNRHFTEAERDVNLKDKLEKPDSLSGILNWCLIGLKQYYDQGIIPPKSVVQATAAYRAESDKIQNYINDCLQQSDVANLPLKDLYDVFRRWCTQNGYKPEGKKAFKEMFTAKLPLADTGTVRGVTMHSVLLGYTFTEDAEEMRPYNVTV